MGPQVVELLERVEVLLELNRPGQALELALRAVAAEPDEPWCHHLASRCLYACGDYAEALRAGRNAIALNPAWPAAYVVTSRAASALQRRQEAVVLAREAVALNPTEAYTYVRLSAALAEKSAGQATFGLVWTPQLREAQRAAATAVRLEPDAASSHFAAGYAAMAARGHRRARRYFEAALAIDPLHAPSQHNLAVLDRQVGRFARSGAGFARVLQLDPSQPKAQGNLLITLHAQALACHVLAWFGYLAFMLHNATVPAGSYQAAWTLRCSVALLLLGGLAGLVALLYRRMDPSVRRLARSLATTRRLLWLVGAADTAMLVAFWVGTLGAGQTAENVYLLGLAGSVPAGVALVSLASEGRRQHS